MGACQGANKQWGLPKYQELAQRLLAATGCRPVQLVPAGFAPLLRDVDAIETPSFRHALAVLGLAQLYIGPEGGLHHGAAAVGTSAVVIFGGFNTPRSTGYAWHENIVVGEPCGSIAECWHCKAAMDSISVDRVLEGAVRQLGKREAA
jgi:ADP-heptose:LPS heptosyltransferase